MRNSYTGLRRIATHPCFAGYSLACPLCVYFEARVTVFEKHLALHDLTDSQAANWLSARGYKRWATQRGDVPAEG